MGEAQSREAEQKANEKLEEIAAFKTNMAVYISSVSGGNCVTRAGSAMLNKIPQHDKAQLWTIERKEGSEDEIAFQSNVDGKYLRCKAGNAYGAVEVGAKQWWRTEEGQAPGSYWLKSLDFPDAYLCSASGSYIDNNKIYAWPRQVNWTHALTWYLKDANASGFLSRDEQGDGGKAAEATKMMEEVKKRAAEETAAHKKREEELKKREEEIAASDKDIKEKSKVLDDLKEKEKKMSAQEKEYEARLKALEEREKASKESSGAGSDASSQAELEALKKQQKEIAEKHAELEEWEKDLKAKERLLSEDGSSTEEINGTPESRELAKENERLRAELEALKARGSTRFMGSSSFGSRLPGARVPPPTMHRPERKVPETKRPSRIIQGQFSADLVAKFEAGRSVVAHSKS